MTNIISIPDWKRAARMWRAGKDTLEIAEVLGCSEAMVYNRLPRWLTLFKDNPLGVGTTCAAGMKGVAS